jgi:hypothetical protein
MTVAAAGGKVSIRRGESIVPKQAIAQSDRRRCFLLALSFGQRRSAKPSGEPGSHAQRQGEQYRTFQYH